MNGLGRVFNVIHEASGVDVPLTAGTAVSFVTFVAAGTQALTLTQTDSTAVNSEIDLAVRQDSVYKGPGVGGTWAAGPTASPSNVVTGVDATNDCIVLTVSAEDLADGYDRAQLTAATGTCVAIIHDLLVQRKPSNLKSSLTA